MRRSHCQPGSVDIVIDGVGNRQGCLVPLREGMRIETQHGRRQTGEALG